MLSPAILSFLGVALASTCQEISGNYYCDQTSQVVYNGLGSVSGSYQRVTDMDADSCTCTTSSQSFSGPLSPLDEDLSFHFRGPIQIAQFAAYTLSSSTTSTKRKRADKRKRAVDAGSLVKRDQVVYTVIPPISTTSNVQTSTLDTASSASTVAAEALSTVGDIIGLPSQISTALAAISSSVASSSTTPASPLSTTSAAPSSTQSSSTEDTDATSGSFWDRTSYYNAASQILDNAVFMNNMGGVDGDNGTSGTWSSCFGNSLSYASTSGLSTSSSPLILGDVTIPSGSEIAIFSGVGCTTETCGYVADGVPAYVGFGGSNKMFLFEFTMPSDEANINAFEGDMPAIWALNAQIPRSQQYGACSCWQTGCGELDLFEILSGGSDYLTTTFHSTPGHGGATSNYFARPTSSYMKAAVIFIGATEEIQIIVLDDAVDFSEEFAYSVYEDWQQSDPSEVELTS